MNYEENIEPYSGEEMDERADILGAEDEDRRMIDAAEEKDREKAAQAFEIEKARAEGYQKARQDVEEILEDNGTLFLTTDADFRFVDEIYIQPKKGDELVYIQAKRGYWEPMDKEDYPLIHPMAVCSECQQVNHYPGRYCKYCGSNNLNEEDEI